MVDKEYAIIGAHVDKSIRKKIIVGDYVDFSRLISHDRLIQENDKRMEIVSKNGQTYFQPVSERETGNINSLVKWDQAYRVFCAIYTEIHPNRANELLQYSHIIHHAANLFIWENVYAYDMDFRIHMS